MGNPEKSRFVKKFAEHLGFIGRSCDAYDRGIEAEAIRMATSLRVLFHDSGNSASLVAHLKLEGRKIFSSAREHRDWQDFLGQRIDLNSSEPIRMVPLLGCDFVVTSIKHWWSGEPAFSYQGVNYSRRRIILSMANRDGGAHVDKELEKYYLVLCAGEYALGIKGNLEYSGPPPFPQGVTHYPRNAHLALVRQFAHEFLESVRHFSWFE